MYIILSNDKIIRNLRKEVDQFITDESLKKDDFIGGMDTILVVDDEENETTLYSQDLVNLYTNNDGETVFSFYKIPKEELRYAQTRSDIEYIAMMSDVNLETPTNF